MVRRKAGKILVFLAACLLLAPGALAAAFTATVDSNQVQAGQDITLQLTLSGTGAKGDPDTSALERSFTIAGQGQTSNTTIINGAVNADIGWNLTLVPKKEGRLTIPPITIETNDGTLSTQPITIDVTRGAAAPQGGNGNEQVSVLAEADPVNPYKNQPIHYTVRVIARAGVANVSVDDLTVENAIVDKPDKPKISDRTENGEPVKIVEYDYTITPLQPGRIVIPAAHAKGELMTMPQFSGLSARDMNNPFKMLQSLGNFGGFGMAQPFDVASNEVTLDVRPPAAPMNPWLPLYSLEIKDEWSGLENAKAGEPLTRKIMLLAEGTTGSRLPGLEASQNHADFKVYADKATIGNDAGKSGDRIVGWRQENYTLIPQKSGKLVIPAARIPWWDIEHEQVAYAELPEKTIDVQPGTVAPSAPASAASSSATAPAAKPSSAPETAATTPAAPDNNAALYVIISGLLAAVLFIALWAFSLQKKITALATRDDAKKPAAEKTGKTPAAPATLAQVTTPQELQKFLQDYAAEHWRTPRNAPLEKIFSAAPPGIRKNAKDILRDLAAALYAGREADMEGLKARVQAVLSGAGKEKTKRKRTEKLPDLNPS